MLTLSDTPDVPAETLAIRAARMEDIYPILALHSEAFSDKFSAAFGGARGHARGVEAMAEAWRRQGLPALRGMFVAVLEQRVVGTISLRTWDMPHEGSAAAELAFHYVLGMWGALRSMFTLSLLDHQIGRGEGYITDVAVLHAYQRRGIARALLMHAEDDARRRQRQYLGLYVSATNAPAIALYRSCGFADASVRNSWVAGWILRQRSWIYMRKELTI